MELPTIIVGDREDVERRVKNRLLKTDFFKNIADFEGQKEEYIISLPEEIEDVWDEYVKFSKGHVNVDHRALVDTCVFLGDEKGCEQIAIHLSYEDLVDIVNQNSIFGHLISKSGYVVSTTCQKYRQKLKRRNFFSPADVDNFIFLDEIVELFKKYYPSFEAIRSIPRFNRDTLYEFFCKDYAIVKISLTTEETENGKSPKGYKKLYGTFVFVREDYIIPERIDYVVGTFVDEKGYSFPMTGTYDNDESMMGKYFVPLF